MKYARRRDANHAEIVRQLTAVGATPAGMSPTTSYETGLPDLVVGYCGDTYLLEVKRGDEKPSPGQDKWHRWWRGKPVTVVRSPVEALRAIGAL